VGRDEAQEIIDTIRFVISVLVSGMDVI